MTIPYGACAPVPYADEPNDCGPVRASDLLGQYPISDKHPADHPPLPPLLADRLKTHGDFTDNAEIMQSTKDLWRWERRDNLGTLIGWSRLSLIQREALEMIAHKVGRILSGDPNVADHWDDIAGYATLVSNRLPKL